MSHTYSNKTPVAEMTPAKAKAIIQRRRQGLYTTDETRDEMKVCLKQLSENPKDKVFTLLRKHGVFSCYNQREWLEQVMAWRKQGVMVLKCNILPFNADEHGEAWMMTVTLPDELGDTGICPLAIACGVMVTGFTYIAKDKSSLEVAWSALGKHE